MGIGLKKRTPGQIEFGIIYGGIAVLGLLAARFLPLSRFIPTCLFKGLSGIPCPTCGATRSIVRLSYGDLRGSLSANPAVSLLFLLALLFFIYRLIALILDLPRVEFFLTDRGKSRIRAAAIMLVLVNWIYLVVAGI